MKILDKNIEVIAYTTKSGDIKPLRFRIVNEDESYNVVKVNRILLKQSEKVAGIESVIYRCQSMIGREYKIYELKYEKKTCRWILWKM